MGLLKYLIKSALKHNPIDAYAEWFRKNLESIGNKRLEEFDHDVYWRFAYVMFPRILKITNKFTWEGDENIPNIKGSFVAVCNHKYALDPFYAGVAFACGKVNRKVVWVSKLANLKTPIMKSIITPFGTIPLSKDRKMTPFTKKRIDDIIAEQIDGVGMFPEGSRSKDGIIRPFHTGSAILCLEKKVPYIPIALMGKRSFFKGKAHARIGKPVYLDPNLEISYEVAKEISEDMRAQVQALYDGKTEIPKCRYEVKPEIYIKIKIRASTTSDNAKAKTTQFAEINEYSQQ